MKKLCLSIILLASCTPHSKNVPDKQWLQVVLKDAQSREGWSLTANGGGESAGAGTIHAGISLNGKTADQAMNELRSLVMNRLKDAGCTVVGGQTSSGSTGMTGFSLSFRTQDSVGNMVFSSAPVDSSKLVVAIAISQQPKTN